MPHSPTPTVARRTRRWVPAAVRGLLALVALAALVAGIPALLLAVGTLPGHLPSIDEARQALLSADDSGTGLVTTMTLAAWAAWLWLTIPVLIEVTAVLARHTTPRLPGMTTGQRLAAYLIASLLLASPAVAASAATPTAGPTATAPHTPAGSPAYAGSPTSSTTATDRHQPTGTASSPAAAPAERVAAYTVGAGGTTWWELAEQLLGDGARYQELRSLNPDVPAALSLLPEGTTLHVPAHLTSHEQTGIEPAAYTRPATAQDTMPKSQEQELYTVRPGDSLSRIAQQELGDATRWPDLYEASKDRQQPQNLPRISDPDVIYPGQKVQLPHSTPPADNDTDSRSPDRQTPGPPSQDSHNSPAGSGNSGHANDAVTPTPSAPAQETRTPGTQNPDPTPSATHDSPPTASPSSGTSPEATEPAGASSRSTELRTTLGAFALLAAAVTGALGTRRLLQRRRRKAGQTIAIPATPSPAAAQLAQLAEPALSPRLDRALRTLARHADEAGQTLPVLRAARLSHNALAVLPVEGTGTPLPPFTAGTSGWWRLPDDAVLLTADEAQEVTAPYPALVTVGADDDTGDLVLLNVAADRVLLLEGSDEDVRQVCTSLVLELGMSAWADRLEIVTVGFGEELTQLLPTSRIAHKRQAGHAVRDLADWLLAAVQIPEEADQPYFLICASSLDSDASWQLAEIFDKARDLPALLIAPARDAALHFADAQVIDAAATAPQQLDGTGVSIILQRLDDDAYQQITADLQISGQPPKPAEGAWQNVPEEPATTGPAACTPPPEPASEASVIDSYTGTGPASLDVFPALLSARPSNGHAHSVPEPTTTPPTPAGGTPHGPDEPPPPAAPTGTAHARPRPPAPRHPPAPLLGVLGTVRISGVSGSSHGPREAQLAALLRFKPGRSADTLCSDMDPLTPWTKGTLNARMGDLRRALGDDPEGNPYVPRRSAGDDPYAISPQVRCDWDEFRQLAEQALDQGPVGVDVLEAALGLVRGRPFGTHLLPWAEPHAQEMVTRIIDVAHTVTQWRMAPGPQHDLTAARQAAAAGLEVDDSAELLYRDWFRVEHASGNRSGLHTAISRLQHVNRSIDASLELETQHLIQTLLNSPAELADAV